MVSFLVKPFHLLERLVTHLESRCSVQLTALGASELVGIPTVPYEVASSGGSFDLSSVDRVVVDSEYAASVDLDGETLIPPTLWDFANTFAGDLGTITGTSIQTTNGSEALNNSVFLSLDISGSYKDAAGRTTSEGYSLKVTNAGIRIEGASPLGAWWGTRTVVQQLVFGNGSIPYGSGSDSPGWKIRGAMLDAGRHFYPPDFLVELCSYFSFFKQNTFHVHMSDNLYNNPDYTEERREELYAAFRPNSPDAAVAGLNKRANESYYYSDLEYIQSSCAARGVTILPELEAPGHALVVTQWKPELALNSDASLLNITVPETIPTMESIWNTFLPWFHSKTVHIGADEYTGPQDDYTTFVNALSSYVAGASQKAIRIWGTFTPNKTAADALNVYTNVSIQHWEFFEDNPYYDYIQNNYSVLNSDDAFYVVNKYSGSYPQTINVSRIFNGNPQGGPYAPNIFDTHNATNNPPRDNALVLGQIAALWNDYGPNTSTYLEAYYAWRDGLPGLADKQWGGNLTESDYLTILPVLQPRIPGQNLDRRILSQSDLILQYNFSQPLNGSIANDLSGNGYRGNISSSCGSPIDGALQLSSNCSLTTPLTSKGRDYTLSFAINPSTASPAPLLSGRDSVLHIGYGDSNNVTFETAGNLFPLNFTVPVGQWTLLDLQGVGNRTFLQVNGTQEFEFLAKIGINGESFVWVEIGINAPLQDVGGGWEGQISSLELRDGA